MSEPLWQPKTDAQARLLGAGYATAGAAALWWQIGGTVRQAQQGAPELRYSIGLIMLGVMFAAFGLLWIAGGLKTYGWLKDGSTDPHRRRILIIAVAVVGLAAWGGLIWFLNSLGYER